MGDLKPGWRRVKLGDVVRQVKRTVADPRAEGITQYVTGAGISDDDLRIREWRSIDDGLMGPAFHMAFDVGHTLYKSRVPHGVAVADRRGICANTTFVLEAKSGSIQPELVPFLLTTRSFRDFETENDHGSTNLFLNWSDVAEYEFALPPLHEQQRTARALDALRAAQERHSDVHTAAASALKAARGALFEWARGAHPLVPLEQLAKGKYGIVDGPFGSNLKSVHFRDHGHPVISSSMFSAGQFAPAPTDYRYVDDAKFEQLARNRAVGGDILVILIGFNCGTVAVLPDAHPPGVITQNCLKITVDDTVARRDYVVEALRWLKESGRTERLVTTTQQRALSLGRLRRAVVPLPPLDRQDSVLERLRDYAGAARATAERGQQLRTMAVRIVNGEVAQ